MNKIDKLCADLIRAGRISLTEALAIGASVRFTTTLEGKTRQEFIARYGYDARDKAFSLLQPAKPPPPTPEALAAHHAAQIRQQQMDGA